MCDRRPNSANFFALSCHSLFSHSTYLSLCSLCTLNATLPCALRCVFICRLPHYTLRIRICAMFLFHSSYFSLSGSAFAFAFSPLLCPYSRMWNDKQSSSLSAVHVCGIVAVFFSSTAVHQPLWIGFFQVLPLPLSHSLPGIFSHIDFARSHKSLLWLSCAEREKLRMASSSQLLLSSARKC